jgi:hypothetical protein
MWSVSARPAQVVVPAAERVDLGAVALQLLGHVAAEEPGAPRHDHGGVGDVHGRSILSAAPAPHLVAVS